MLRSEGPPPTENAIALKTFLGSKDPDVNATIFMVRHFPQTIHRRAARGASHRSSRAIAAHAFELNITADCAKLRTGAWTPAAGTARLVRAVRSLRARELIARPPRAGRRTCCVTSAVVAPAA